MDKIDSAMAAVVASERAARGRHWPPPAHHRATHRGRPSDARAGRPATHAQYSPDELQLHLLCLLLLLIFPLLLATVVLLSLLAFYVLLVLLALDVVLS